MGEKSFYGDVDKGSQMPGWYFEEHQRQLDETIKQKENALRNDFVPASEKHEFKENLERDRERLAKIQNSKPKFNDKEKDELAGLVEEVGVVIGESLFKRSDMEKGIADAHEEVKRQLDPSIKIDGRLAEMAGITLDKKGFCSRNDATKAWKLGRKILEENSNVEVLRRD